MNAAATIVENRVPPHDLDAEAAVLSAVMNSRETFDKVADLLRQEHFYSESHRRIWEACVALTDKGVNPDIVSVGAFLKENGRIAQIGGMGYLTTVLNAAPALANTRAYAETVHGLWKLRQTILVCQRGTAQGYAGAGDVSSFVEGIAAAIFDITCADTRGEVGSLKDAIFASVDQIAKANASGRTIIGLPTGFTRHDRITSGLHRGELTIVAARPGMGKALTLDTPVLTPTGWRRNGDLTVGDTVIGSDGRPTRVLDVYDQGELDVFRVTMDDGGSLVCCDDHLWWTRTRADRRARRPGSVKALRQIRSTLTRADSGGSNHSLPFVAPVEFAPQGELPLRPWFLGCYAGDGTWNGGSVRIDKPELDIQARVRSELPSGDCLTVDDDEGGVAIVKETIGPDVSATSRALSGLGLGGCHSWEKFIPRAYLFASIPDRVELLRGLCDTDGYVTDPCGKSIEFSTTSIRLRDDVEFLVGSLGGCVTWEAKQGAYRKNGERHVCRTYYRMVLSFPRGGLVPVSSKKHLAKWNNEPTRISERFIRSVDPAGRAHCRCIRVEAPDALYVAEDFIVTHNTALVLDILVNICTQPPITPEVKKQGIILFSLEMPKEQIALRMLASEARLPLQALRLGALAKEGFAKMAVAAARLAGLAFRIDDTPALSITDLRARSRRTIAEEKARGVEIVAIAVDYLQLMRGHGDNREQEISSISRGLKQLAKELGVPVIALAQLNRMVEGRSDKRAMLSDLRESGAIEQDADNVIFIYRDDYYNKDSDERNIAELNVAKQRNGPTDVSKIRWDGQYTRFDNLAEGEYEESFDEPPPKTTRQAQQPRAAPAQAKTAAKSVKAAASATDAERAFERDAVAILVEAVTPGIAIEALRMKLGDANGMAVDDVEKWLDLAVEDGLVRVVGEDEARVVWRKA